jgi:hypothetical protein
MAIVGHLDFDRVRALGASANHRAIRREIEEAVADAEATTIERLLRRLFSGPPNTGIDNSYVPERFAVARAVLAGLERAPAATVPGPPTMPWPHAAAPAFLSTQLDQAFGPEGRDDTFRFVDGDLRIHGNLILTGQLLVAGDLDVDGAIDSSDWQALMVAGDVACRALECSESYALIAGALRARELVLIDDGADARIGGALATPGVVFGELGGAGIEVSGADHARRIHLDDAESRGAFVDGLVGPEEALFSWHLMRAVMRGVSVWKES